MSNKSLPVVLILLVLAVAGYLAIQFAGGGPVPVAPGAGGEATADAAAPASGDVAPTAGGVLEAGAAERQAVAEVGSGVADASVPCLVGLVEDAQGQPVADAQVLCGPRGGAMFDIDWENVDAFDPDSMANMARRAQAQRVAVTTGPDGRFRIRPPAGNGEVSLRITARGHRVFDRSANRPGTADLDLGALRLELGAVVQGRVLDPRGNPIEGARVLRLQDMEAQFAGFDVQMPGMDAFEDMRQGDAATSDADGRFELPNARPGEFVLRARHPDRPSASSPKLTVAGGATLANVILTLPAGATIRGKVVGAPEGQKNLRAMASLKRDAGAAIPGMPTDLGGMDVLGMMGDVEEMFGGMGMPFGERQVELGSDGSFEFRGLEPGKTYRVWAVQQGRGFVGGGQCTARVEVGAGNDNVELRYEAGVTVTMTVRGADDQPVEQLTVRDRLRGGEGGVMDFAMEFGGAGGRARPAKYPEGKVTIANLRPKKGQKLTVDIASLGFADWQQAGIELPATGSVDLGVVKLQPVPTLSVLVTAADGGAPIAGARVRLAPERNRDNQDPQAAMEQLVGGRGNRTATTDAQGRVALNALGDVAGTLRVTASDRAPVRLELPPGAKGEQKVAMVVGGTVAVAVVDGDGKPVAGVEVELRGAEGSAGGNTDKNTDADGRVRFANLAVASYRVRIAPQGPRLPAQLRVEGMPQLDFGGDGGWTDVVVAADRETVEVTLTKAATATLTGIVRENGVPLADARVAFVAGAARTDVAEAGAEGAAREMVEGMFEQFGQSGGGGRSARTDQSGAFTLKELPEGAHRLRISHRGRAMPFEVPIVLRLGEQDTVVELDMTAIRGVVLDHQGQPVGGARVSVRQARGEGLPDMSAAVEGMMPGMNLGGGGSQQARSDDQGQYELRGVAPGVPLQVRATARGHAPAQAEVTVQQGEVRNGVEIRLLAGGKIAVTVEGQSQPFAMVMAMRVVDGQPTGTPAMQMLRRGKATLADLEPGTYEVRFQGMQDPRNGGGDEKKQQVEVVAGETVTVAF